ncbi:ABC transporter ATP-binding protein [Peptoniphilus catoniae]|uniref:ABC transporter ATP-binding protein n=1 Tax=Peptoniphilus catoniae TaxID=1660341 RepID=UPI0010FD0447|nr:ABC transporter ATP-binding protein [Peptoniphilus catoniae]
MDNILEVKDLRVSFKTFFGEVEAVRGVSFNVPRSKTVAIVGESGCGKSVTANSIMKLLPDPPAFYKGGSILFEGEDIVKKTDKEMRNIRGKSISMVFQDPMTSLNPTMKVGKQIMEGLLKHENISKEEAKKRAIEILKMVSVPKAETRIDQYPHEFSGGMRQRVMIAIAMVMNPKLMIADEPTTALDVTVQAQILDLMKKLQNEFGMSIILITHDLGVVADMSNMVEVMYAGQIMEEGTTDDIFYNTKHPYTRKLLASLPRLDMDRNNKLQAIHGTPPDLYIPPKGCPFYERCDEAMVVCKDHPAPISEHGKGHLCRCWLYDENMPKEGTWNL